MPYGTRNAFDVAISCNEMIIVKNSELNFSRFFLKFSIFRHFCFRILRPDLAFRAFCVFFNFSVASLLKKMWQRKIEGKKEKKNAGNNGKTPRKKKWATT